MTNVAVTCAAQAAVGGLSVQYVRNRRQRRGVLRGDFGRKRTRPTDPAHPAAESPCGGVAHNFIYVLPVEAGLANNFGDGLDTLQALDAEDQYNLTIIEPTFAVDPWYADNPDNANEQYETWMTSCRHG